MPNIGTLFASIQVRTGELKRGLTAAQKDFAGFTTKSSKSMRGVGASITAVASKIGNLRNLLIGGGLAAGGFFLFRSAIKESSDFQFELGKVASLVKDTELVFNGFSKAIKRMAVQFGQSKSTLTKGLFDIISATIGVDEAINILEESTKLAVAGFTTTGTATSAVVTVFQTYNDEVKGAADATDFLFAVQKRGRLTVADVAENIGTVAASAKAAGITINDLGGAFSAISRTGIGAQKSVILLLRVIQALSDPTEGAVAAAAELGVTLDSNAITNDNFLKTIVKLNSATLEQKNAIFSDQRAFRGFNALVSQSSELMNDLQSQIDRVGGSEEALIKALGLSKVRFLQFAEAVGLLKEAIGEVLIEKLTDATDKITKFIQSMEEEGKIGRFVEKLKSVVDVIGKIISSLNVLAAGRQLTELLDKATEPAADLLKSIVGIQTSTEAGLALIKEETEELKIQKQLRIEALKLQEEANKRRDELLPLDALPVKKELAKITEGMKDAAEKWKDIVKTPFEIMQEEIFEITKLLDAKLIDQKTFDRAGKAISDTFLEATKKIKKDKKSLDDTFSKNMTFLDELVRETARSMQQSFSDLFFKVAKNEFEDFRDFLTGLWDSMLRIISDQLSKWVSTQLTPILQTAATKVGNIFGIVASGAQAGGVNAVQAKGVQAGATQLTKSINGIQNTIGNLGRQSENTFIQMDRRIQEKIRHIDTGLIPAFNDATFSLKLMEIQAQATAAAVASIGSGGVGSGGGGSFLSSFGNIFGGGSGLDVLSFQHGGIVPGGIGVPVPAIVHGGEEITPPGSNNPPKITVILNNPIDPHAFGKSDEEIVTIVMEGYARNDLIREVIRSDIGGG